MSNNTVKVKRKTRNEVKAYKDFVKHADIDAADTIELLNENLVGSDQCEGNESLATEEPSISVRYRIKRFIRKNTFQVVISVIITLITMLAAWYGSTLIQMKVDYAVLQTRVSTIENTLNELETDTITKELLDLQLDSLKQELNNSTDLSAIEIDARIDLLEQQIDFIKDVKGTAE